MPHNRRGLLFAMVAALALLVAGASTAWAQDAVVRGTITSDRGEPIAGANVVVEELRIGVVTSATGQYTLNVPGARVRGQPVVVRVRAIGFKPNSKSITLTPGEQAVDLTLGYDVNLLEAIVVTGTQEGTEANKVPFTVNRVDASQLPVAASNPLTQLQGKVPGANIVSASGRPGSQPAVLLRGPTSINASGRGQDPLYIVDGVIINGNLSDLNPRDIENVEVVEGAAGASLYGARAGNGVINITTKSARRSLEGVKFGLRSEAGVSDIERDFGLARYQALATDETGTMFCEAVTGQPFCSRVFDYVTEQARINNNNADFASAPKSFPIDPGSTISGAPLRQRFQISPWPGTSYNAVNQMMTPKPFMENSVDMSGRFGTQTRIFASASNRREQGAIRYLNGFTRNAFRINIDQGIGTDWNFAFRTSYTRSTQDGLNQEEGGAAFFRLTRVPAIVDILQRDSLERLYIRPNLQGGGSQNENPLSTLYQTFREDVTNRIIGGFTASYNPVNWFNMDANFSYDLRRTTAAQINDKGFRTTGPLASATNLGQIFRSATGREAVNGSVNATLKHDFGADFKSKYFLRYLFEQRDFTFQSAQGSQLSVQGVTALNNTAQPTRATTSDLSRIREIGLLGGSNFEYKGRYILDALVRRDGSSLFGPDSRWATFGRASLGWRISQEPWWSIPAVTEFRVHGSYGTAGGSPRFDAQYETFNVGAGGLLSLVTLGNRNLKPELHREVEFGGDLELWGRYAFNMTYAHADIERQIIPAPIPASTGFQRQWLNVGTLQNKTLEMSLNIPLIQQRDLQWSTRVIYDRNRSVVTKLDVAPFFFGADLQGTNAIFQAKIGERLGTFYGHRFITSCSELPVQFQGDCGGQNSSFQRNDEGLLVWVGANNNPGMGITNNLWETFISNPSRNANVTPWGITVLNWGMPMLLRDSTGAALNVPLGNALPDFRFGITQDLRVKRFSFYALLDASLGQKIWNQGFHWAHLDFLSHDVDQVGKSVQDAKPIGYYWRTSAADGFGGLGGFYDQLAPNSYTVEDASYAKLREMLVSYHIGPIGHTGDWEISLVGRNLFTITGYRGFDPEVGLSGGTGANAQLNGAASAAINAVDAFTFPNLRTFTIGLSSTF